MYKYKMIGMTGMTGSQHAHTIIYFFSRYFLSLITYEK